MLLILGLDQYQSKYFIRVANIHTISIISMLKCEYKIDQRNNEEKRIFLTLFSFHNYVEL